MVSKGKNKILQKGLHAVPCLVAAGIAFAISPWSALASDSMTSVPGKLYEMGEDSHYEFSTDNSDAVVTKNNTYGTFSISGNIVSSGETSGIPTYRIGTGGLDLLYHYDGAAADPDKDDWHIVDDKSKKLDSLTLDENIMKGAIVFQTSTDGVNWITARTDANVFGAASTQGSAAYSAQDIQLTNGCYYRVIVAYKLQARTEEHSFLFINTDKYDTKKCVEVYEFYADTASADEKAVDPDQTYRLGAVVRVGKHEGYSGEKSRDRGDPHYGWDLGNFYVSGYTAKTQGSSGDMVFLKNVGDTVTLWFRLDQNIDALNGDEDLRITADNNGYDQQFQTMPMDLGRGALIIRYTDHNNNPKTVTYTDYLAANVSVGADTKVQMFEEGDYEVALDYEVTEDKLIDAVGHYRIYFKFSVRNGNCMVYPFDVTTGSELTNSSMTPNGFRLDLAKSLYLDVTLKREVLRDSADGLTEDTRFNGPAKDGATYTEEGIYTITAHNQYTDVTTAKKIYVGTNNILKAYMTTGYSIPEINDLVAQGATILDDGTIQLTEVKTPAEEPPEPAAAPEAPETEPSDEEITEEEEPAEESSTTMPSVVFALCGLAVFAVVLLLLRKRSVRRRTKSDKAGEGDVR